MIARLDFEQNTWVWRRSFTCSGCSLDTITGLALSPDGTTLAAYGTSQNNWLYDETGYFFLIATDDAHYISDILQMKHGS